MKTENKIMPDEGIWLNFARRDYEEMTQLQKRLHQKRRQGEIPDVVILLEHNPCFTIGRSGSYRNLLAENSVLHQQGITVHETPRGGDITYHGPGQIVCYPILSLQGDQRDLHAYARKMEEVMIRTLDTFDIKAERKAKYPGVWVKDLKIGAMGIAVKHWVTMHGIALNVCPNLEHFSFIVPCGISAYGVTSMSQLTGHDIEISQVRNELYRQFCEVFHISMHFAKLEELIEEKIF